MTTRDENSIHATGRRMKKATPNTVPISVRITEETLTEIEALVLKRQHEKPERSDNLPKVVRALLKLGLRSVNHYEAMLLDEDARLRPTHTGWRPKGPYALKKCGDEQGSR